jgi:eukaryotic-like serine/threonine-protein kinase
MSAPAVCPTCETPVRDNVCRLCAFSSALAGISALSTDDAAPLFPSETPEGYELLKELGRGASAVVWLAREHKLERLVALKLISAGTDRRLTQRLVREGQAVARLRHPHIVVVHAMGATETQAFLGMEFLAGGDLRQQLAGRSLVPVEAALLVRKLADALAHAHQHEILHRDIKPSNVLLDANGEPHLADFGLAAPLEGGGDLTLPGQVAGTPAYLAPELLTGADQASALSDVYSLGALLYECLTGRAPFVGDSAPAILAQVSTAEPPAPRLLQPGIPRDLETICLKCLEKVPSRRYSSAGALHADLGRFLQREPIAARPVGVSGRSLRWCRRHPSTAAFAGVAAILLLGLAIGGPIVAFRLSRAQTLAATEAASSKAVSDFLENDLLAQASPTNERDRDLKLRTVLDRAAKKIDGRFPNQPSVEARIRGTLRTTYTALGDYATAHRHAEHALQLTRGQFGEEAPETLIARRDVAELLLRQQKSAEAEKQLRPIGAALQRALGPEHIDTLRVFALLGIACTFQGKLTEGETIQRAGLATLRRVFGPEHATTLEEINALAITCSRLNKLDEAEALHRELNTIYQRTLGPDHPQTLTTLGNLSVVCHFQDKFVEAEGLQRPLLAMSRQVLGPEHPDTLLRLGLLANSLQAQAKFVEAESLHREAFELKKRILGAENPATVGTMNNLALTFLDQKKFAEAEALYRQVVEIITRLSGPEARGIFPANQGLAKSLIGQDRLAEAESILIPTVTGVQRVLGPTHPGSLQCQEDLGAVYLRQGKLNEAEATLRETLAGRMKADATGWRVAATRSILGDTLAAAKRFAEAEPLLVESYEELRRQGANIPTVKRFEKRAAERLHQFYRNSNQPEKAQAWQQTMVENNLSTK